MTEEKLSIRDHINLAERHANTALALSYKEEPQSLRVRMALGRAQSILISLLTGSLIREKEPDGLSGAVEDAAERGEDPES